MKTLAVLSLAGGMGRTTTVLHLGQWLAQTSRVLVVDLAPQGGITHRLLPGLTGTWFSMLEVLTGAVAPEQALRSCGPNHWLLPADWALELERNRLPRYGQEQLLAHKLALLHPQFDYGFIDTPATKGLFTAMACCAADGLLVSVMLTPKGVKALSETLQFHRELKEAGLPVGSLLGVLPIGVPQIGRSRPRQATHLLEQLALLAPCFPVVPDSLRAQLHEEVDLTQPSYPLIIQKLQELSHG